MKRKSILLVLILSLIIIILPIQAADFDLVSDEVGLLTEDEYLKLNNLAQDISEQYQNEMSIVIVEDKGDQDIKDFTKAFYNDNGYGYGEDKSGLMLLISMADRDYAFVAYGSANTAFTDHGKVVLAEEYLLPMLGEDKYYDAFLTYLNQTGEYLNMAENGSPFDVDSDEDEETFLIMLAIVILLPLLIAGIVCFIFYNQMKTAVAQEAADKYICADGVNITMKADKFLYRTETRTKIEKESSSGGTSVDDDGSSSSSGKF